MSKRIKCECGSSEWSWRLAINEDGWHCNGCEAPSPGEPRGYNPHLDRAYLAEKVGCVLFHLHEQNIVYMSNSEHGDSVAHAVVHSLRSARRYSQHAILLSIARQTYSTYWDDLGRKIVCGTDTRGRCDVCGALALRLQAKFRACSDEHMCQLRHGELF